MAGLWRPSSSGSSAIVFVAGVRSAARTKAHALNAIAQRQHGIVARGQALECGYSDSAISRFIEAGLWKRVSRGVYKVAPATETFEALLMALILRAPGRTWASHRAAARLWGFFSEGPEVVEVSTAANVRNHGRRIHRVREMPARDRTVLRGLPATRVERTLIDVAAVVPGPRLEAMVVSALRLRLTSVDAIRARLEAADDTGRFGPPRLRKLLDRWTDLAVAESVLEARLRRIVRKHGLPRGVPQLEVFDGRSFVARVDLAYPGHKVAVEADGYRWHGDPARWQADLARRNALTRLGWRVLHFTWNDVHHDEHRVASEIRAALDMVGRPLGSSFSPA